MRFWFAHQLQTIDADNQFNSRGFYDYMIMIDWLVDTFMYWIIRLLVFFLWQLKLTFDYDVGNWTLYR